MKRLIRALCLLFVLLLPLSATADIRLEQVWLYMPTITAVNGTDYVVLGSRQDNLRGLYRTSGEEVIPFTYPNLSSLGNGFFSDYSDKENINTRALLYEDGRQISDYVYASFKTFNRRWAIGFVLTDGIEEDNDAKISNNFYIYERCDLYYVGPEAQESYLVGSIAREQYAEAAAHGDMLAVKDREEHITVYDRAFNSTPVENAKVGDSLFALDEGYNVINKVSGQVLAADYAAVSETRFADGLWVIATRYRMNGTKYSYLLDPVTGDAVYTLEYPVASANRRYAVITDGNKKRGLYSLEKNELLIPAEYDSVLSCDTTLDGYIANGYTAVQKDKMVGYIDMATGGISCPIQYPTEGLKRVGCVMYYVDEGSIRLISADGVESVVEADGVQGTRGDGYLLVIKKDNLFGVIDWHGNLVLPIIYAKAPVITDDSQAIIFSSTGLELNRITAR